MQLIDFGERRLITEILERRYGGGVWRFGDDVAVVADVRGEQQGVIVATIDPAPEPAAWRLVGSDYYSYGWLTAALNLSDLAAAGADPLALLTSFVLPNDMRLAEFERLLDGVDDCCRLVGARVSGGNLKEGHPVHCEATAIGIVPDGWPMSRNGAHPGDVVCAIGNTGFFWAGMLAFSNEVGLPSLTSRPVSLTTDERNTLRDALLKPVPLVKAGSALRGRSLPTSCTDNSDGLYGALWCLTQGSGVGILVDADSIALDPLVTKVAAAHGLEPIRLAFGFGDLQLLCTLPSGAVESASRLSEDFGLGFCRVGEVVEERGLWVRSGGDVGPLANLDNERFTVSSQFTGGIEAYEKRVLRGPLFSDVS